MDLDNLRQRDLQRRNHRLLAIAGGSAAIAVLTVSLAIMAFLSDAEAQRRRAQAEDLIGFMVGDLYQGLQEIGRLDVFMSVGNKAMEYFFFPAQRGRGRYRVGPACRGVDPNR